MKPLCAFILALCLSSPAFGRDVRIALLSDPHVNLRTNGAPVRYGPQFDEIIRQVNDAKVGVVLIAGDLADAGKPEEWSKFKTFTKKLDAPVFYVPGNHDVGNKFNSGKTNGTVTTARVEEYEKNLGPSFFAKECAGLRIIGLNSSILGSGFDCENKQWNFLELEMARTFSVPTVVFMHYAPFLKTVDETGGQYYNLEPEPRKSLLELLDHAGVKTILTGHLHKNLVTHHRGITIITTEPISFGIPAKKQPEGWTLVTIAEDGRASFETKNLPPSDH